MLTNFEFGAFAYQEARELEDNPHKPGTEKYEEWEFGWLCAERDSEKR